MAEEQSAEKTDFADGSFDLALTAAPDGTWRPYLSGEVASVETGRPAPMPA